MIWTIGTIELALRVADKMLDLIILVIKDMPEAERKKSWNRWFKFWNPLWEAMKLDVAQPPI